MASVSDSHPALQDVLNAISSVESKGYANKYSALGKPNSKGQRAYGKYQVMDFNIPTWTKEALGYSLTPKQFLNNPDAQEAVAKYKIGQIYQQYGNAADTASVWFSGRPVAKAGNDRDVTGTTVPQYVKAVLSYLPSGKNLASEVGAAAQAVTNGENAVQSALQGIGNTLAASYKNLTGGVAYYRNPKDNPTYNPLQYKRAEAQATSTPAYDRVSLMSQMPGNVTTPFGGSTTQEGFHPGIDIAAKRGTPIPSTINGTVTATDYGHQQGENNFGNNVTITDSNGDKHRFSHMNRGYVKMGDRVIKNQNIGEFGNTGATYSASGLGDGTNLDYRISDAFGRYKNPMLYLNKSV